MAGCSQRVEFGDEILIFAVLEWHRHLEQRETESSFILILYCYK